MTPAITQIMELVGLRLRNIAETEGYFTTVRRIERARMTPWQPYDLPAANYWPTDAVSRPEQYGEDARAVTVFVEYHDKTRDEPFCDVADRLAHDIVTALNRSPTAPGVADAPSYDLGGSVVALAYEGHDYEIGEGQAPWCGVLVRFRIEFRAPSLDMTTFIGG